MEKNKTLVSRNSKEVPNKTRSDIFYLQRTIRVARKSYKDERYFKEPHCLKKKANWTLKVLENLPQLFAVLLRKILVYRYLLKQSYRHQI